MQIFEHINYLAFTYKSGHVETFLNALFFYWIRKKLLNICEIAFKCHFHMARRLRSLISFAGPIVSFS